MFNWFTDDADLAVNVEMTQYVIEPVFFIAGIIIFDVYRIALSIKRLRRLIREHIYASTIPHTHH
jgi:hypothetical protein